MGYFIKIIVHPLRRIVNCVIDSRVSMIVSKGVMDK